MKAFSVWSLVFRVRDMSGVAWPSRVHIEDKFGRADEELVRYLSSVLEERPVRM